MYRGGFSLTHPVWHKQPPVPSRQFPALKAARRWKFYDQPRQFEKLALSAELDTGSLSSLTQLLQHRRYQCFRQRCSTPVKE